MEGYGGAAIGLAYVGLMLGLMLGLKCRCSGFVNKHRYRW